MSFWGRVWTFFKGIFVSSFEKQVSALIPFVQSIALSILADPSILTDKIKRDAFAKVLLAQLIIIEKGTAEAVLRETIQRVLDALTPAAPVAPIKFD